MKISKNMSARHFFNNIAFAAIMSAGAMLISGCSLMHDDLHPCAVKPDTRTTVQFIYDFNTADADQFSTKIGGVTLYVFDATGKLLLVEERTNVNTGNALKLPGFCMDFDSSIIRPGETYSFYAVAHGHDNGYSGALTMPGAAFHRSDMIIGEHSFGDYSITLDCDGDGVVDHEGVMIDDLWATRTPVTVTIDEEREPEEGDIQEPDHLISVVIPLIRITNSLTLSFWQTDFKAAIDPAQYDVTIETSSGSSTLDITGNRLNSKPLIYKPVKVWQESKNVDGETVACVKAEFGLSRIMIGSDLKVVVKDNLNNYTSTLPNLATYLARGNDAFAAKKWGAQEYLDREHDFDIDFPLGNPIPKWVGVNVGILSWSKRYQIENL